MARKYEIKKEEIEELEKARKSNRDKKVDRRLHALILHAQGYTGKEISEKTGYNEKYLYALYGKYLAKGLEAITGNHYGGNHRNMTYEEERQFLRACLKSLRARLFGGISRHTALLFLEIHKGFLRKSALSGEKSARKSAHAEILNRL